MITQIDTDMNVLFVIVLCLSSVWPHYTRRLDDGRLRVCQPDYRHIIRDGKSYGWLEACHTQRPDEWLLIIAENWLTKHAYKDDTIQYGDLHRDGMIDYRDVAVLARHWPQREQTTLESVAMIMKNDWMCNEVKKDDING